MKRVGLGSCIACFYSIYAGDLQPWPSAFRCRRSPVPWRPQRVWRVTASAEGRSCPRSPLESCIAALAFLCPLLLALLGLASCLVASSSAQLWRSIGLNIQLRRMHPLVPLRVSRHSLHHQQKRAAATATALIRYSDPGLKHGQSHVALVVSRASGLRLR